MKSKTVLQQRISNKQIPHTRSFYRALSADLLFDGLHLGPEAFALFAGPARRQFWSQRGLGSERVLGAAIRLEQEAGQVLAQSGRLLPGDGAGQTDGAGQRRRRRRRRRGRQAAVYC